MAPLVTALTVGCTAEFAAAGMAAAFTGPALPLILIVAMISLAFVNQPSPGADKNTK